MKTILLAGIIGISATAAIAHSPLKATSPADGSKLEQTPAELSFDFKGKIRLTRVTVRVADDTDIDLDLSAHKKFTLDYALPIEDMGSGVYEVEWRGLGTDGHAQKGVFNFTVE